MGDFEDIKQMLSIRRVAEYLGAAFKGSSNFADPAPCCGSTGACAVDDSKGLFKCFSCEAGGSLIDLICKAKQIDPGAALKEAAALAGITLKAPTSSPVPKPSESKEEKIYRLAAAYYQGKILEDGSPGYAWFIETRKHKKATLKNMGVGYSGGRLLEYLLTEGFTPADVVKYGLARDRDKDGNPIKPRDYFTKGLCIFPVVDHAGKIITFKSKDPEKKLPGIPLKGPKKWFLNHKALGRSGDLFVVEGENDIAALMDVGFDNVVGTAGAPGKDQIRLLKNHSKGRRVLLWFDRDAHKDARKNEGGPHHTRFIYEGLKDSGVEARIISHPGDSKDPDEYILTLDGLDQKKAVKALIGDALDPVSWEIDELKKISDPRDRLTAFDDRGLPQAINSAPGYAEKELLIRRAAKAVDISAKAIEDRLEGTGELLDRLEVDFRGGVSATSPGLKVAEIIYKWFEEVGGGRFFKTTEKACLFYHGREYDIGPNDDFNGLMYKMTRLAYVEKPGASVWYFLKQMCNTRGELVEIVSWLHTDREKDVIYCNLNSNLSKIIRLAPGKAPELIENGTNEHSVLLGSSPQIKPFEYQPSAEEAEGFSAAKILLMDTTPAPVPQRYFYFCWLITTFLMDYTSDRGLMQIMAHSKIGKSKVAERSSNLLYGASFVGSGTGPADVRIATRNPISFLDNIENKNLNQARTDFLLLLANGAVKPKSKAGSDTEVLYQRLKSKGMITSIEAFPGRLPELINRTYPLMLEPRYKQTGYMHDEVMRQILKDRSLILSAILKMIGRSVLPRLSERAFWSKKLSVDYAGHNKDRMNEDLCLMLLVLEGVLEHIPYKPAFPVQRQASELLDHWIAFQQEQAKDTELSSNSLLTLLDGLAKEIYIKIRGRGDNITAKIVPGFDVPVQIYEDPEYKETFYLSDIVEVESSDPDLKALGETERVRCLDFVGTAADIWRLMNRYCAGERRANPFENPTALGSRLGNDRDILEQGGWDYVSKEGRSQYKKIMGAWHWRLSKRLPARE